MDNNTTFKYWLAVARHTSYKIGKQPRPAFVGGKQVPGNLNQAIHRATDRPFPSYQTAKKVCIR